MRLWLPGVAIRYNRQMAARMLKKVPGLLLALAALALLSPPEAWAQRRADPAKTYSVPVGDSPARGPERALVTLVTACEFSSPFCRRIRATFDQLMSVYEGDLRIAYKHYVVYRERSTSASLAACAAHRQGHFFEMEAIIWSQRKRTSKTHTADEMVGLAKELGLDAKKFTADMNGPCKKVLADDRALMDRIGTRGVPASYVNGRFIAGARSFSHFQKLIDEELAKAKERVARGAKATNYYRDYVVAQGEKEADKYVPKRPRRPARDDVGRRRRMRPDPAAVYAAPVGKSPVRGPADAKVTMVFGCQFSGPFCKRIQPTLSQLREDYGADLRIVYKHIVVHRNRATAPALAACAAHQQKKYFDMEAILWGEAFDKRTWDADSMRDHAESLGLDMKRYDRDIEGTCPKIVAAEHAEMNKLGARGTPSVFINGRFLSGAHPIGRFKTLIDQELAKANAVIKNRKQQRGYYRKHVLGQGKKSL